MSTIQKHKLSLSRTSTPRLNRADACASSLRSSYTIMRRPLVLWVFVVLRLALANGQGDREQSLVDREGRVKDTLGNKKAPEDSRIK